MSSKLHVLLQWLLVLWAAALVLYFEVREGLIRWEWLYQPVGGENFFHEKGWPDPRFERPPSADLPVAPYVEILKNAMGPYDIQWQNAPWLELLISLGMILGYTLIGWMLLTAFRVFMPLGARLCLALTLGCGMVGIAGEGLGLVHQLNQRGVAIMWGILLAGTAWCWVRNYRRRYDVRTLSVDTQLTSQDEQYRAREWFRTM